MDNCQRSTGDSNLEFKWIRLSTANCDGGIGSAVVRGPWSIDEFIHQWIQDN